MELERQIVDRRRDWALICLIASCQLDCRNGTLYDQRGRLIKNASARRLITGTMIAIVIRVKLSRAYIRHLLKADETFGLAS